MVKYLKCSTIFYRDNNCLGILTMQLAPIVLFVYNRPGHTEQTLVALAANTLADQSSLFIYSDGPKEDATLETIAQICEVREVIRKKKWCKHVHIVESQRSILGLCKFGYKWRNNSNN